VTELSQPRRHTLLAIDMERYSARSNVDQYQAQRVFRETLDEAARLIGLDRSAWRTQPSGDGELRRLVERHGRYTGSSLAAALLAAWDGAVADFWHVRPRADVAAIEDEHEGTGGRAADEAEEASTG